MNEKDVLTEVEERRHRQSSLLSTFEEIAQTFLNSVSGERGNRKVFASLQEYLDDFVLINGAYCRRRSLLLAIHDLKEELEAPSELQSKTLAKLELLHLRPVPRVTFYQDIAIAILRMEVVIRLEASQAPAGSAPEAAAVSAPAQAASQQRSSPWKVRTIGYGLAAVACCAGAIIFLQNGDAGDLHAGASAQLAAVGRLTDTQSRGGKLSWPARDCVLSSNDEVAKHLDESTCTPGAYNQRKLPIIGNSFNAADFVIYSALAKVGLGSVIATPSQAASSSREMSNHPQWATTVEANNNARPILLSEVKTQ